ncbi:hypothetical protein PIB30_100491 [Stylosanthes scabra]|uniref:Uncharacterized protein n=1 Tax=Stylosanthes scabra TaxID=79078 RepID=A0ABU6VYE2_9FABA|nr:hypothetical protein [Stylosanthes scabra]
MGDLLGSPRVAPLFQYLFLPVLLAADPRPGSSATAGRAFGRAGLHGEEMGPARPLGGGAIALGGPLMMIVCAYIGGSHQNSAVKRAWARVVPGWVTSWEVLVLHLFFNTSFLPVLPAVDPCPGSSGPAGWASGWAGLHGEEMGPARPLGGGAVALGGPLMMIVCAYIGSTSILLVLPAADPRLGRSAPAGLASGRAGLHGEEMGPASPLGGGAVALGGALMMIVCAYIGRCDHTNTNAPDPIRTPQLSVLGRE